MIQPIAAPETFRDVRVRLLGFVAIEHEGTAIYLHRNDFARSITPNAIWLNVQGAKAKLPERSGSR